MPSIDGRLEWDDDTLTPGNKREGGLHHTLFDDQGRLSGSARFIPGDEKAEDEKAGSSSPETVFVFHEWEPPPKTAEREAFEAALSDALVRLAMYGLVRLSPHALRFWHRQAHPKLSAVAAKLRRKSRDDNHARQMQELPLAIEVLDPGDAPPRGTAGMTPEQLQALHLLAIAARSLSDEQIRSLADTTDLESSDPAQLEGALAQLPAAEIALFAAEMTRELPGSEAHLEVARMLMPAATKEH